ncbi:MAG: starch-binding protein [Lachnospiraceae bacterium]|nr:starch-binding protein [Lachnospiraceae bacterium]
MVKRIDGNHYISDANEYTDCEETYTEDGYEESYEENFEDSYEEGFHDNYEETYDENYQDNYEEVYDDNYSQSDLESYDSFYDYGIIENDYYPEMFDNDVHKGRVMELAKKMLYELELYQVMGIIGALLLIIGSFCPMITIEYFGIKDTVFYFESYGAVIIMLAIIALLLIVLNKHKYVLVPSVAVLLLSFSIRIKLIVASDYISFRYGFYIVMLGTVLVLFSTLLINYGYARNSAFRKNKPLYFEDIVWIGITIFLSTFLAYLLSTEGILTNYVNQIDELEEASVNRKTIIPEENKTESGFTHYIEFEKPDDWEDEVYIYIYKQNGKDIENMSKWPGKLMETEDNKLYTFGYDDYWKDGYVLFSDGERQIPFANVKGLELKNAKKVIGSKNGERAYSYEIISEK